MSTMIPSSSLLHSNTILKLGYIGTILCLLSLTMPFRYNVDAIVPSIPTLPSNSSTFSTPIVFSQYLHMTTPPFARFGSIIAPQKNSFSNPSQTHHHKNMGGLSHIQTTHPCRKLGNFLSTIYIRQKPLYPCLFFYGRNIRHFPFL